MPETLDVRTPAFDWKDPVRAAFRGIMRSSSLRRVARSLSQRGALPSAIWSRLPVTGTFWVYSGGRKLFQYESTTGDQIGRFLFWRGLQDWEHETCEVFVNLCRDATTVLDIGANTGVFTLLACAANPDLRVISFEPVPRIYSRLRNNVDLNNLDSRCETHNIAVADSIGLAKLHVPIMEIPTSASLHSNGFRGTAGTLIEVQVASIDSIVPRGTKTDLVKIDVEGFEDKVLNGMRRVLSESRPSIIVECNPDGPFASVETILREFDYNFFHLRDTGAVPVDRIIPDKEERYRNFLCVHGKNERLAQQMKGR